MKTLYNSRLKTGLLLLFCVLCISTFKAQVSVSSAVSPLINSIGSNTLSVTLNYNNNSCAAGTSTVTIAFPSGVTYVPGSVIKTAGSAALNIGYVSGTPSSPQFTVTGGNNGTSITFTLLREANCAAVSTNDTIYVTSPCITTSIGTALPNTNKSISTNYSIGSPYLFITPSAAITNASIGSVYTRTISVGNSGIACIDTLHFFTIRKSSSLQLVSLQIGGTTLVPVRFSGDTAFYDIAGALLPTAGSLCNNGQSVVFTETVKLLNCVDLNTKYGAGWGNGTSLAGSSVSKWCALTQTPVIPITLTNGVANFSGYNYVGTDFVNMCSAFNYTTTYTSGGNAPMYNTHIKAGLYAMWWGPTGMSLAVYNIHNAYLLTSSGALVPMLFTFDAANDLDVNMAQFTTDPDGPGIGFSDLNGDGIYNDLPAGTTFTLVINRQFKCNETCNSDNYIDASAPNGSLTWEDMCGTPVVGQHLTSGPYYYGASGNIVPDLSVSIPPNVVGGTSFNMQICPTIVANWNYPASAAGHYWEWKVVLPPGVTLNSAGYGSATSYTLSGDTVIARGNTGSQGLDCFKANLVYTCGATDTLSFSYSLTYINDITSNCRCRGRYVCGAKLFTVAKCPSNCAIGLAPNKPQTGRTNGSFGYTDNTLTTHVSPSSVSPFERQLALYLDTIFIKGSAVQLGNANNGYIEFKIDKSSGANILVPELSTSTFKHYRSGAVLTTVNGLLAANVATLSTATKSIYRYNFTSNLSGGQLLNNDSIEVDLRFIVSTNNLPGSPTIPSGISWQSFNIINSVKVSCDSTGWIPIIYPINSASSIGSHGANITSANCGGVSSTYMINKRSVQMSFFENEYRPAKYTDSITVFIPNGYVFDAFILNPLDQSYSAVTAPPQTIPPTYIRPVAGGQLYTFVNNGTWPAPPIHTVYQYGLGSFRVDVKATCSSPVSTSIISHVYCKEYYYAYAQPRGTLLPPSVGAAYLNSGSIGYTINYPAITKPAITISNQTGTVIFAKPTETFNIRVNSTGFNTATNVWVASDGNPNITITQIVETSTSTTLTPNTYTVGAVSGSWFALNAAGIPSGSFKDYTVYFTYKACTYDSIKIYGGWNCNSFPVGNPLTDPTTCATTPIYIKVNPQSSRFQMSVTQNPRSPGINLCTNDTVMVVMNSIDAANVVNPSMTFTALPGVNISGIQAEYPLNSGQWQPLPYTTSTGAINSYVASVGSHTNIIAQQGLPGTYYGLTPDMRQVRVRVIYSTDCNYVIGSYIGITGKGYRVCDTTQLANSDYNGFIRTSNINVNGTSPNGATAGMDLSMIPPVLSCANTLLPLSVTPYFQPTVAGDMAMYILPDNITYVPGSFVSGVPTASLGTVTTVAGTTTLTILLPAGVAPNTPITYSISVNSCGKCKPNKIKGLVSKSFSGFTCNGIVCSNFAAVLGEDSTVVSTYNRIVNTIRDTVCVGSIGSITTFTGTASTTHTFTAAGDYTVSVQAAANDCDSMVVFALRLSPDPPRPSIADTNLCDGKSIVLSPAIPAGQNYSWYSQAANGTLLGLNSYTTPVLSAGTYTYYVEANETTSAYQCKSLTRDTVVLTVFSNPVAIPVNHAAICIGQQTATLTAGGATTYSWMPATGLSATTGSVVLGNPVATQQYTVIGTDTHGCVNDTVITITVHPLPTVTVNSSTICVGQQTATLTAAGAMTYTWSTSAISQSISVSPALSTNYTVTATDGNHCTDTATTHVFVNSLPLVTATNDTICVGQQTATLTASGATSYTWSTAATAQNITVSPAATTIYTVTGTDGNACTNTATASVLVYNLPPVTATGTAICIGQQTATLTAAGALTYTWSTATVSQSLTVSPVVNTTYTVTGTDGNACTNTATASVLVNPLPIVSANSASICIGQQTATLTAHGASSYSWTPNVSLSASTGSVVLANPNVTTTYTIEGTDAKGCVNYTTTSVSLWALPVMSATGGTICVSQQTAAITASGATTYTWLPNSGLNVNTGASVNASPNVTTTYTVSGTDVNGCTNYTTALVDVKPLPQPAFSYTNACINAQPVSFNAGASSIAAGTNTLFAWDYGDGTTGNSLVTSHTYNAVGLYTASLSITSDFGCKAGISHQVEVYQKPFMSISASSKVCLGGAMSYTANSLAGSGTITNWFWDFDRNISTIEANGQIVSYTFATTGTQTAALVAQTDKGCRDTLKRTVYINYLPNPQFSADRPAACPVHCVTFKDSTPQLTGPAKNVDLNWTFGDGTSVNTLAGASPEHCYTNRSSSQLANFDVKLIVKTDSGCVNSIEKQHYITVYPMPVAAYSTSADPGTVTAPLVMFSNQSKDYTTWKWNFGDESGVDVVNVHPSHFYGSETARTYYSYLVVYNQYGCKDSVFVPVEIKPEFVFYIPNTFTPGNQDGLNDIFTGTGLGIDTYEMWIFDRWGGQLYHTNDINQGWNGKARHGDAYVKQDVYVWRVLLRDVLGKTHEYVGHVTVIGEQ